MRKKTSKEFGCILTHEQEEFINDGRPRDNALKIFRAKAYGNGGNKDGKKMPKEVYEKVKHTMFAKGNVPPNHRPVGSERISKDGYIEVKVAEPNKWRLKQRVVYEEAKGKIPEGCTIIFLDGNKRNFDIDNLRCITRSELLYLNCNGLNNSNEITETGILMARLDSAKNKKKQELKDKNVKKC